jgi:hypothetical protein
LLAGVADALSNTLPNVLGTGQQKDAAGRAIGQQAIKSPINAEGIRAAASAADIPEAEAAAAAAGAKCSGKSKEIYAN